MLVLLGLSPEKHAFYLRSAAREGGTFVVFRRNNHSKVDNNHE